MSESKHVPTPWSITEHRQVIDGNGSTVSVAGIAFPCGYVDPAGRESANAEFIVRACNSHNSLVEACREAVIQLRYLDDKFMPTGTTSCTISRIEAAIKSAEEGL